MEDLSAKEIAEKLKSQIDDTVGNMKDNLEGKIDSLKVGEIKENLNKLVEKNELSQKQLDELEIQFKKLKDNGHGNPAKQTFASALEKQLKEDERFASYSKTLSGGFAMKAAGTMLPGTQVAAGTAPEVVRPGIIGEVRRNVRVRDLLPTGSFNSDAFKYVAQLGALRNTGEGAPAVTAAGDIKPLIDKDISKLTAPAVKIAGHMRVAEELINDIPGLTAFLSAQGTADLYDVEDAQLLYGDGTSGSITGVTDGALVTATSNPLDAYFPIGTTTVNTVDAIVAGIAQLAQYEYVADGVLINPVDYFGLYLLKGSDAHYIRPDITFEGSMIYVAGVPVFMSTAVTAGDMIVGNWSRGAQLMQREGVSVRFYDQDQDNAIRNLVTIVLEERIALPIYYPNMFTYDAIADVTGALVADA